MYQVYTQRKGSDRYYSHCVKKNMTKEEAIAYRDLRMSNPNRICAYVVVPDSRVEEYFNKLAEASKPLMAKYERMEKIKEQRWREMDAMYKRGYHVRDAVAYLNA